jgi:hypothetical protein
MMKSMESKVKLVISVICISLLLSANPFSPSTKLPFLGSKGTDGIDYRLSLQLLYFRLDDNNCVLLLLTIKKLNVLDILLNWYRL